MSLETVSSFVTKFPVTRNSNMADGGWRAEKSRLGQKIKKKKDRRTSACLISHTSFLEERKYANMVQGSFCGLLSGIRMYILRAWPRWLDNQHKCG
jgi:hypothetical protein